MSSTKHNPELGGPNINDIFFCTVYQKAYKYAATAIPIAAPKSVNTNFSAPLFTRPVGVLGSVWVVVFGGPGATGVTLTVELRLQFCGENGGGPQKVAFALDGSAESR